MKVIILAAGQGTRLRPLTDEKPKCMVEVLGRSIIDRQMDSMMECGIEEKDIYILAGYCADALKEKYRNRDVNIIINSEFESTNMVYTLMCAKSVMKENKDILISYGDIFYTPQVLDSMLKLEGDMGVVVDNGWYGYWEKRCENPLDDAETLKIDEQGYLTEIGKKTMNLEDVQSQYIGLIRAKNGMLQCMIEICEAGEKLAGQDMPLENMPRTYRKMYMTDLLQYMIEQNYKLKAVSIDRGWYEIDNLGDLKVAEDELKEKCEC